MMKSRLQVPKLPSIRRQALDSRRNQQEFNKTGVNKAESVARLRGGLREEGGGDKRKKARARMLKKKAGGKESPASAPTATSKCWTLRQCGFYFEGAQRGIVMRTVMRVGM